MLGVRGHPPIWNEARFGIELTSLLRDPVFRGERVPHGAGQPVLLIPGFLAGDDSLGLMTRWLRRAGYRAYVGGIRSNVDCGAATIERLTRRLELFAEREGQRVAIVGQSRGGGLARVMAVRRPDLVSGIFTLGTPHMDPMAVHPFVALHVAAVGLVGTLGFPGLFKRSCLDGGCCATVREDLAASFPSDVGFCSIYSRIDGIVNWQACLDRGAWHFEVRSSHCGMGVHPETYRLLGDLLPAFREGREEAAGLAPRAAGEAGLRGVA